MARKQSTNTPAPNTGTDTGTEAPVEAPVDLTAFSAAVEVALAASDEATGSLTDEAKAPVVTAYRDLPDTKAKNASKRALVDRMKDAMSSGSLRFARAASDLSDSLTSAAPTKARKEAEPVDPTEAFVARVAAVQLGYGLTVGTVPEGVAADWSDKASAIVSEATPQAQAYQAWLSGDKDTRGDEPDVSAIVKAGVRIASGRGGAKVKGTKAPFTGERRDVGAHIANAFADKASGAFLTVSQIVNTPSAEYGTDKPSAGAVSARLFPGKGTKATTVPGITAGQVEGKRGATKD